MSESVYPYFPVMLVDDEEEALDSFQMALRSANMNNFIRCQDSRQFMSMFSQQEIEVVLLDLRMPHVSGEELLPLITHDFPQVPVIVVTGVDNFFGAAFHVNFDPSSAQFIGYVQEDDADYFIEEQGVTVLINAVSGGG